MKKPKPPFQLRVKLWMMTFFGKEISRNKLERGHRFIEEALELVQAGGLTRDDVLTLVKYVYDRPTGELRQEAGGVMVTLAAFCLAHDLKMLECGEVELKRVWGKLEQIREKQKNKPRDSALPQ